MSRVKDRVFTDEEKIKIALARFGRAREDGQVTKLEVLAEQFKCNKGTISRIIIEAFEKGLIEIQRGQPLLEPPKRLRELEDELVENFRPNLGNAIVIEDDVDELSTPAASASRLHERLGMAMAAELHDTRLIRTGQTIGVGSGRGVYHTIQALQLGGDQSLLKASDVTLVSLNGLAYAFMPTNQPLYLESDIHLTFFAFCFAHRPKELRPLANPIAYTSRAERNRHRANTHLSDDRWKEEKPQVALVGLGVLAPGHRFFESVSSGRRSSALEPLGAYLKPLVELCQEIQAEARIPYVPCGDVCDRLFYVPPPKGVGNIDKRKRQNIERYINEVNSRLLSLSETQLGEIESLLVVAGTPQKAPALCELLRRYANVACLCTDRATAEALCQFCNCDLTS